MKTIALFDFDNTLYNKDSLLEFTKFSKGGFSFYRGILMLSPYLLGFKLRLLNNESVKLKFIQYFFKSLSYDKFVALGHDFALNKIEKDINKKLFETFNKHIQSNHQVYIITASIAEWIEPWSNIHNVKVIGTKLEVNSGKLTGRFDSKNCYGIEKVKRIKELVNINEFDTILVYGYGKGDREMLNLSTIIK